MQEQLNNPPEGDAGQPEGYPRSRYIILLVILLMILVLVAYLRSIKSPESVTASEVPLEAELLMKMYYGMGNLPSASPAAEKQQEASREKLRSEAVGAYRELASKKPTLAILPILRRLIIIDPSRRAGYIAKISEIRIPKSQRVAGSPSSEARLWSDIYLSHNRLSPDTARSYAARIRKADLGWYQHLALSDMYERAGMSAQAAEEHSAAMADATRATLLMVGFFFVAIFALLIGIGLLFWYVMSRSSKGPEVPTGYASLPPHIRSLFSGYLLEVFVLYMVLYIALQFVTVAALFPFTHGKGHIGPHAEVLISFIQYVVWGAISLAYLSYRLREAGYSLRTIGLVSTKPARDIAWGIGGYLAAAPLLLIVGMLSQYLTRHIQTPENPIVPLFMHSSTWLDKLLIFAMASVAAPFFEEIFFRGTLFGSLRSRWGLAAGLVLSAVIFAAVHPLPFGFLSIFVLGFTFATLMYQRGSLLPGMVAHCLNNTVAFIVLMIMTS